MTDEREHSQFLAKLLSNKPLRDIFLKTICKNSELYFSGNAKVCYEVSHIDIQINFKDNKAILIENKINAVDQNTQVKRYYSWAEQKFGKNNFEFYYLSPLGSNPTPESLNDLNISEIKIISYADHIIPWLQECIEKNLSNKEVLSDYLSQWETYLHNTYYKNWCATDCRLYGFFQIISLLNLPSFKLEYVDEPLNKSHIPLIIKGNFHLNFAYQEKDIKLIYDKNENDIFFRMNTDDFETSNLNINYWEKSSYGYDCNVCKIEMILNYPDRALEEIIEKINRALKD